MKKRHIVFVSLTLLVVIFAACNTGNADDTDDTSHIAMPESTEIIGDAASVETLDDTEGMNDTDRTDTTNDTEHIDVTDSVNSTENLEIDTTKYFETYTLVNYGYHIIFDKEYFQDKKVQQTKTVTLFGETFEFQYDETEKSKTLCNDRIRYQYQDDKTNTYCLASFDSVTGRLLSYANTNAGKNRAYQSEVNDKSGEAEFLAYAKKLISQYASVEGCEVEIKTSVYEYDEDGDDYAYRRSYDKYVNNTENVADYYAIYRFTFYKTINGIRRLDTNSIEIHSTGEVDSAGFYMQDELYADFADAKVDMKQAEELAESDLASKGYATGNHEFVPRLVATDDGILWLSLDIFTYTDDGASSGYNRYFQISRS